MGVIQALISLVADADDTLRTVRSGGHVLTFLIREPLYLMAVAQTEEPEVQLRYQLTYLHDQILSIVSHGQLQRAFRGHSSFDLRKLLTGTEAMLDHLVNQFSTNFSFALGSIETLRLPPRLRERLGLALKLAKSRNVLYALLVSGMRLITMLRPKETALYSSDLHLLLSTVGSFTSFQMGENWIPICLPRFNRDGFLHVYICYLVPGVCLLLLSPDKGRFAEMSAIKSGIVEKLTRTGDLDKLQAVVQEPAYSPAELGVPGLRHFVYRLNRCVQHTSSLYAEPYVKLHEQESLLAKYHRVWALLHDQKQPVRIVHQVTTSETILGWSTAGFELYATFGPLVRKTTLVASSNQLIQWVKKFEEALFAVHPPTV
ncbi:Vacuolar fusion protein mon1 [Tieghemiomyces parasiticus]|uniref:Vacuolar fusion protein MON1 n=1 Tax=Tieghemiomyces parasiticus TaxID=78921 RepID=A0A9W8AAV5_9FUNG|nr:Vacuolar fusion protein mon1 [Tieghemiomyces parasiticus]